MLRIEVGNKYAERTYTTPDGGLTYLYRDQIAYRRPRVDHKKNIIKAWMKNVKQQMFPIATFYCFVTHDCRRTL